MHPGIGSSSTGLRAFHRQCGRVRGVRMDVLVCVYTHTYIYMCIYIRSLGLLASACLGCHCEDASK